jgi:hypothetical protein
MQIQRSGRTSKDFSESLDKVAKEAPGLAMHPEERLDESREDHGHAHEEGTEEKLLGSDRKAEPETGQQLIEKNLRDHGVDKTVAVVTEKQLNEASGGYPHRNEKAYRRTGDKRPINALDEEMGNAGDASKRKRYEQASKPGKDRILDKDVGKQLTNDKTTIRKAFNLKNDRRESASKVSGDYVAYREANKYNHKFEEVSDADVSMSAIMALANKESRNLTEEEMAKIAEFKEIKSRLLGIKNGIQS